MQSNLQAPLWPISPGCSAEDIVMLLGEIDEQKEQRSPGSQYSAKQSGSVQTRGDQDGQEATALHWTGWTAQVNAGRVPKPLPVGKPSLAQQTWFTTFLGFAKKRSLCKHFLRMEVAFSAIQFIISEIYPREMVPQEDYLHFPKT